MGDIKININPQIPIIPKFEDKTKINVRYVVIAPYVSIHIYWDNEIQEVAYEVEEPILSEKEKENLKKIELAVKEVVDVSMLGEEKTYDDLMDYIDKTAQLVISELSLEVERKSYEKIFYYLYRDFLGLNEIEPMMRDYFIEDVECNGVNEPIYIVHRAFRNLKTSVRFTNIDTLSNFVEKLAQKSGRYISYASPILDGSLPDGSLDYEEPVIYKENGKIKISKIGEIIDRFYDEGSEKPIYVENIEVPAFDRDLKIKWRKADYVYRHKINEEIYEIKTEFGKKIKLTGCHSIFSLSKKGIEAKKTCELKQGDYVAIPLTLPENPIIKKINLAEELAKIPDANKFVVAGVDEEVYIKHKKEIYDFLKQNYKKPNQAYYEHKKKKIIPLKLYNLVENLEEKKISTTSSLKIPVVLDIDCDLMRFLGLYTAEGWLNETGNHHRISFCFNKNEKHLINEVKKIAEKFGANACVEKPKNNAVKVTINSLIIHRILNNVLKVSKYAKKKRIPEIVFNVSPKLQEIYLRAWADGDYGSTASKELMNDIIYLSLFQKKNVAFYGRKRESQIGKREISSYEYYTNEFARESGRLNEKIPVEIFNPLNETHLKLRNKRISRERLREILGDLRYQRFRNFQFSSSKFIKEWTKRGFINDGKLSEKGDELVNELATVEKIINSDLGFAKILSVKKVAPSKNYVYDFSVSGDENFIGGTGGLCCHNSRVNATYTKDISSKGPTFTIRKFTKTPWTPTQLIGFHTLSPEMLAYFWLILQYQSNLMIVGGTASGKTTLLNAIAFFIPQEKRVVSIEDSVTGDSRIIIKQEGNFRNITIKEFVEKKIDAEVMTLTNNGKIVFVRPSKYIKHSVNKDIYEVLTSSGRKIKVTQDHSLFSLENGKLVEVKPINLSEGKSFIAVPRMLPIKGNEVKEINLINHLKNFKEDFIFGFPVSKVFENFNRKDLDMAKEKYRWCKKRNIIKVEDFLKIDFKFLEEDLRKLKIKSKNRSSVPMIFSISKSFLEFCGLWLGDGSYDNYNKNSVILSNGDIECQSNFRKVADYLNANYSVMNDKGISRRIHSSVFYKFMKYVIGLDGYSNTKNIPDFIYNLSNEQISHFIRGYFSADGTMKKNEVSCSSQSYTLLEDLQTLLLRFGIIGRINDFNRKDKCINLSISGYDNMEKFKEIGFLQDRKNEKLYFERKKPFHTFSDVIPLSVNELKEINEQHHKLSWPYLKGKQNIGREYLQKIAIPNSKYNDLSHTDIFWDRVKKITKISSDETEVFDLSIPCYEKFLCNNIFVHNTRELNLPRENWLPSVVRSGISSQGIGAVDMFSLLRGSFRQNPDYVIVGEVRGAEASVLFQGMASGHASISTMHADSVESLMRRLETPPINLSPTIVNGLDSVAIMTHAIVNGHETRRLRKIVEVIEIKSDGTAVTTSPFVWSPADDKFYYSEKSVMFKKISEKFGIPEKELIKEFEIRVKLLYKMYLKKIVGYEEVQKVINEYQKNPKEVLKRLGLK